MGEANPKDREPLPSTARGNPFSVFSFPLFSLVCSTLSKETKWAFFNSLSLHPAKHLMPSANINDAHSTGYKISN